MAIWGRGGVPQVDDRRARPPAWLALRHGCPISMAPTPARNGNGIETAARS